MADTAPALIALNAGVRITGPAETREIPLADLYSGDAVRPIAVDSDEILTEVLVPGTPAGRVAAYSKFSLRGAIEFGALGLAVALDVAGRDRFCRLARIAVGSLWPAPQRAFKAESLLKNQKISNALFLEAARAAAEELQITPHHGYSRFYLRKCLQVQLKRTLHTAAAQINA
jgi:CO/xanthine dehydrogenase FAD-binding subunit